MNLADIIYPYQNDIKVILSKRNKEKLESFILSYKNADKLNSLGIDVSNSLLLYGPPGCGKTKCAYLIAKQLNLPLVVARLDSLISSYLVLLLKIFVVCLNLHKKCLVYYFWMNLMLLPRLEMTTTNLEN